MAKRTTSVISNVQYESKFEWKEEKDANILRIHLPDFEKEQLKIAYVPSTRIIRVTGEREIAPTKWAVDQSYAVPENCNVNISAEFADGILTIKLPKSNVKQCTLPIQDSKLQEDRQRMVNIGLAALAVAAVGAYLYCSCRSPPSSGKGEE